MTDLSTQIDSSAVLPEGYTQRPGVCTPAEAEAVANLYTVAYAARGDDEVFTAAWFLRLWESPHWDIITSSQVCVDPQGQIVGYFMVGDRADPTHPIIMGEVLSGEHWEAIMRVLMAWAERRALQALARCQPEERFAPIKGCDGKATEQLAFFKSLGYHIIRYAYHMSITLQEAPLVIPLPAGFQLKTFDYPAEFEALVTAFDDIWHDHYGYVERPMADVLDDWKRRIETDPQFDASMWFLALDEMTGEIAGLVLCSLEDSTKPSEGHINIVGVRRAYRKRGLAQAMLLHAFSEYWARGKSIIGLGVDADSPTGATRLYERIGMARTQMYVRMEKEMRPGVERMNTGR